jgi:hypothetical protein
MARLRNITITVDEDVARWARIEAAKEDTSVSRLVGEMLREQMAEEENYEKAMKRALRRKPFGKSDRKYLTREETAGIAWSQSLESVFDRTSSARRMVIPESPASPVLN